MHHVHVVESRCTFFFFIPTNILNKKFKSEQRNVSWMRNKYCFRSQWLGLNVWTKTIKPFAKISFILTNSNRMFILGWTIPLTSLRVPLQERPQSSQLAVQWSAWFLAGWKSASECESSSCGEGGERANCLGRISTLPLLRSEMKRGWCLIVPT